MAITDLNTVKRWFDWNMLSVNMKKTHFLPISLTINSLPDYDYLCFDGDRINRVEFTRYLGVYVDCHLRWDIHSVELHKRLRKILYKIRVAREILPWDMRYTVYYALVQSVLQYGISAWGGLVGRYYLIIERAQKRLLKVLFEKPILFPTEMLFRELRILDPRQLYLKTLITSIPKFRHRLDFMDSTHRTRQAENGIVRGPRVTREKSRSSLLYRLPQIYNVIPSFLKMPQSFHSLKKHTKSWLLDSFGRQAAHELF